MQYHYTASESSGRVVGGDIEAESPAAVLDWMITHGLKPISIKVAGVGGAKLVAGMFRQKITIEDQVFLTKYLALMLRVGTDLFSAIDILIADFDKPVMKALLVEMKDGLGKGQSFYSTFSKHPSYFSPVFVSLIKAAEASGNLEKTLGKLSSDLEKQWALRNKVRGALIYPLVLVTLSLVVLFAMVTFVLPRIAETFTSGVADTPAFSRIVFSVGFFFRDYMAFIVPIIIIIPIGLFFFFRKTVTGRRLLSHGANRIPVIKEIIRKLALQRFASTLASLVRSGTPILESLEITAEGVGNVELRDALQRISREGLSKGLTIGEAFKREAYFPRAVVNLVAISEKSGHLEDVLETLADFYESEIDASIKAAVSLLEPALLLFIGGVVGLIAIAVILPVYQLVGQI